MMNIAAAYSDAFKSIVIICVGAAAIFGGLWRCIVLERRPEFRHFLVGMSVTLVGYGLTVIGVFWLCVSLARAND
jgi:hypothetical protein